MCSQSLNKPDYRCLIGQTLKINVTHTQRLEVSPSVSAVGKRGKLTKL